jgi:hypothetical protein
MSSALANNASVTTFLRNISDEDLKEFICRFRSNRFLNRLKRLFPNVTFRTKLKEIGNDIYLLCDYTYNSRCSGHITFHLKPHPCTDVENGPFHVKNNSLTVCQRIKISYTHDENCDLLPSLSRGTFSVGRVLQPVLANITDEILNIINRWFTTEPLNNKTCGLRNNNKNTVRRLLLTRRGGTRKR